MVVRECVLVFSTCGWLCGVVSFDLYACVVCVVSCTNDPRFGAICLQPVFVGVVLRR